jgi:subtilisin family serine protease
MMTHFKTIAGALLATTMLTACQVGSSNPVKAINLVKEELNPVVNSNFGAIAGEISALEAIVNEATGSATISAILNPTEADKRTAENIVSRIDDVINSWEAHKAEYNPKLLAVKMSSEDFRRAEAVVKILKEDLRPVIVDVTNGKGYDTEAFAFLESKEKIDGVIDSKKIEIFENVVPTLISSNVSSVTVDKTSAATSPDRLKETIVVDGEQTVTGGSSISDLTRTATWVKTTTKNMEYDRSWTVTLQNVTTYVYSDGSTKTERGEIREVPYTQTLSAADIVTTQDMSQNIAYTVEEQNDPTTTITRGGPVVVNEYADRVDTITQEDSSKVHNTIRTTTTTSTTPVTTTLTYPKISVYTYTDGHSFTHDATDEVVSSTEDEVVVNTSEATVESTTEHVVASETVTNEVITDVTEADPVFDTTYEDKTTTETVDGKLITTVTRYYTTTATIVTTTTTNTTPVTKQIWTDGTEKLIRGETVVETSTENTVVTDSWTKVMSTTTEDAPADSTPIADDHPDMGTRTAGFNSNPVSYRTSEFNGTSGQNYKQAIKADVAYSRGWTGKGSLITIADTGYDKDHSDLAGAVKHEFNTLTNDATFMDDNVGHGSHVLGIAAGRRNGSGTHGVAFDADVAVVKVTDSTGYSFQRARTGAAWARDLGSVAFNVSANSREDSAFRASLTPTGITGVKYSNHWYYGENGYNGFVEEAKLWKTALGSNQVLVNSAGNFGNDYSSGSAQMAHATDASGNLILGGRMLVVGSYDLVNNRIASYSNKAGTVCATWDFTANVCKDAAKLSDFYILAPGDNIQSAYKDGTSVNMSGTSMAAPVVTGALAIIHQMWPHMKGKNLVKLLLVTADKDLPGYAEHTHGQGMLDLDKATQPVGATGIPTSGRTDGEIANLETLSGGAGIGNISSDAFAALSNVTVLDSFERDFTINLNNTQAIDTRPGSSTEALSFGADYDGYWNLANAGEATSDLFGIRTSFKFDPDAKTNADWGMRTEYDVRSSEETTITAALGMIKETGKFLNNVQEGFMGVGESHTTNYAGLRLNHKFDENWFAFGNFQLGITDVESSKEFSLVTGYSNLVSNSWGVGAGYKFTNGWTVGANFSQPMTITSGKMNYKVPVGRTLDGQVLFNEGSADASTKNIEYDTGLVVKYNVNNVALAGYAEHRSNVAGVDGNNEVNLGVKLNLKF